MSEEQEHTKQEPKASSEQKPDTDKRSRRRSGRSGGHSGGRSGGHPGGHPGASSNDKPKDFSGTLRKLLSFLGRFKFLIAGALLFAVGSTIFSIIGPRVLSTATTELFNGVVAKIAGTGDINFDAIGIILLVTFGLYMLSAGCSFVQGWIMTYVSQRTCYELRKSISEKIDRMPMGFFERHSIGDVLSRITNDIDTLGQNLNQGVTQLITSTVTVIGVLVMMLLINPLMTLIAVIILPVSAILVIIVVRYSQKYFRAQQHTLGEINGLVEETFSGQTIVKAFNREEATVDNFDETNNRLFGAAWRAQFVSGLMQPIMNFVSNLGYVAVAIAGSILAVQGTITVGDIQAFIQYVRNFTQPITQLTQVSSVLQQMVAAAERIFQFLSEEEEEPEEPTAYTDDVASEVEFDHVHFGYDPEHPVIHDFSAMVNDGMTVALVGPTGAGKTTLVKLLLRFYEVQGGAISLGGVDVRNFARDDLRSVFGMVLQDTWLFNGTIRENIRYGRLEASDEEVEAAAKAAYIHHFIMTLPDGYDTVIGEEGGNISQGQRQLITIARAILADRRILILDEATSSVDTRTEERIQRAMDNLMADRTSFVIAHRLSTIKNADLILVIRDGDIVEQGNHESLLEQGGFYADLYNSQFSETIDEAVADLSTS